MCVLNKLLTFLCCLCLLATGVAAVILVVLWQEGLLLPAAESGLSVAGHQILNNVTHSHGAFRYP